MNTLNEILNQKVIANPEQWFESVCKILFYRTVFHIKDQRYKITEAELYLKTDDLNDHPDVFTHGSHEQRKSGLFYFHKKGRGGIDITFGKESSRYGGILLRGMESLDDKSYIDGPLKLSQRIVEDLGGENVKDVVRTLDIDIFNDEDLWLEETSGNDQVNVIYKAPRVGLALSKDVESHLPYFAKLYRYLADPLKTKKGKELLSVALKNQGHDPLLLLEGLGKNTLNNYMALFQAGVESDLQDSYKNNELFHIGVFGELSRNN